MRLWVATVMGALLTSIPAGAQPAPPAGAAPAPAPMSAADAAKQAADLYNAGDYGGAVAPLQHAVELEPNNFEYQFALAQALRQSGNCGDAVPHYKAALAAAPAESQSDVSTAMAACPNAAITQQQATPPPPAPPAEPVVVSGGLDMKNAALLVGAGAGLAAGLCMFIAASSDDGDADAAASYKDHDRIETRATRLRIGALISAGAGVALGAIAVYRIKVSKEGTQLSFAPRKGGAALVLEGSW